MNWLYSFGPTILSKDTAIDFKLQSTRFRIWLEQITAHSAGGRGRGYAQIPYMIREQITAHCIVYPDQVYCWTYPLAVRQ